MFLNKYCGCWIAISTSINPDTFMMQALEKVSEQMHRSLGSASNNVLED